MAAAAVVYAQAHYERTFRERVQGVWGLLYRCTTSKP